jgi:CBS-domain-containing membrane protein
MPDDGRERNRPDTMPLAIHAPPGRLTIPTLLSVFPDRIVWACYVFSSCFIAIAVLAGMAMVWKAPFIFPSLGATAFLLFFNPTVPAASPRNAVVGHAIGIVCGYAALLLTGLQSAPPALLVGVSEPRILATALSLAATGALMVVFRVAHPPAGATTLIVSLGLLTKPPQLLVMALAVAALTLQAILANRIAGVKYPLWAPHVPSLPAAQV